ncbi:MAG: prepilin-type N-terminal cleavage/methylation domain-containing protein [Pirellulaceae bacterium]|nr:prepilin-type N-terminal cleavage/methylation domain-containing protein [Pirellulaceae bacterium]
MSIRTINARKCGSLVLSVTSERSHRVITTCRNGFTLLELMLVLAIIAAIGAITFPAFSNVFERQRLQASAEKIRLELDRARLLAMRTGQAQMFECAIGQGKFSVHPLSQQSDLTNTGDGAKVVTQFGVVAETTESGVLMAAEPNALTGDVKDLEEKITFVSCVVATDSRAYNLAQQSMAGQVSTANVGQVIIFYPDGSTSNAEVRLQNSRGEVRAVRLRGLTGHVKVLTVTNVSSAEGDNP